MRFKVPSYVQETVVENSGRNCASGGEALTD
jgi:hypothetical protein